MEDAIYGNYQDDSIYGNITGSISKHHHINTNHGQQTTNINYNKTDDNIGSCSKNGNNLCNLKKHFEKFSGSGNKFNDENKQDKQYAINKNKDKQDKQYTINKNKLQFDEQDEQVEYGNIGQYKTNINKGNLRDEDEQVDYGNVEQIKQYTINKNKLQFDEQDEQVEYGNIGQYKTNINKGNLRDEDEQIDYGNVEQIKQYTINKNKLQIDEQDEQVEYDNIGQYKINKNRRDFAIGNNNEIKTIQTSNSNETLFDDDFDSDDDWDDSPEPITYPKSFSSNVTLDEMSLEQLLQNSHTQNLKWTQIMEKFNTNINHLSEREKNLQDAKYELISSEWSFFKAINILYGQFVEKLFIVLSKNEENKLFAYVKEVKDCSEKLLKQIESSWKNNTFSDNFCTVLNHNLETFDVYVHYCCNQIYSEILLGEIVSNKSRTFKEFLNDIQCDPVCNGLHLHAYQLIPVRKITNFPVLIENILRHLTPNDREYKQCQNALYTTKQLLDRCNTEMKLAKDHIRTKTMLRKLEFPKNSLLKLDQGDVHMRNFIKSDNMELTEITSSLFGKKVTKKDVFVFLFNDIFVVTKKCNANKYMVIDYCFRINIKLDSNGTYLNAYIGNIDLNNTLYLHIKENKDLKSTEMILSCKTRTDAIRWIEALDPSDSTKLEENANFCIRKVIVQRNYSAVHSDEISLTIGEKYAILRETEDGWSFGQREKDGECGWFLTEHVLLVDDVRQRVDNVKKKYHNTRQH